jgi:DNA-binding MarR family transcriptional regulator
MSIQMRHQQTEDPMELDARNMARQMDQAGDVYLRELRHDLEDLPVHGAELRFLTALYRHGALSGSDLARYLGVSRAAASILGKRLLGLRLVECRSDRRDRRRRLWSLTVKGGTLLAQFEKRREDRVRPVWAALGPEERRIFVDVMNRLFAAPAMTKSRTGARRTILPRGRANA